MADKPFRILLDVRDLYLEDFKYVWVTIYPHELITISDFKKFIVRRINLERDDIQLFMGNGLLLDDETIFVLEAGDTVRVHFKTPVHLSNLVKDSIKENTNYSRKRTLTESDLNDEDGYQPKRKVSNKKNKSVSFVMLDEAVACSNNEDTHQPEKKARNKKNKNKSLITIDQTVAGTNDEDKNQPEKTECRKKDKNKTLITLDQTEAGTTICKKKNSDFSFNSDSVSQKQDKNYTSFETTAMDTTENVKDLSSDSQIKTSNFDDNVFTDIVAINSFVEVKTKTKRKRKRRRKNTSSVMKSDLPDNCDTTDYSKSISVNANNNINRKHILYLSPDRNQENNCSDSVVELQNSSTGTFVLKDKSTDIQSSVYPKISTPSQPNACSTPDWQVSLMNNNNSNLSYSDNGSVFLEKPAMKNASQNGHENKAEKDLYESLPDLNTFPALGVGIAYKVLELDDSYSPTVSDYRKGIVKKVNHDTGEIEVKLIEDIIVPGRTGKFENLAEDEIPEPIIKKHEVLQWNDMISPKVYCPI